MRTCISSVMIAVLVLFGVVGGASANNLRVTNVVMAAGDVGYTYVQFDISWDNSWRASWEEVLVSPAVTVTNWDAAWIFVKYRHQGGDWQHASLSITNAAHIVPAGSVVNVGLSTNAGGTNFGCGVFLYRAAEACGSWTNTGVKLRWNHLQDGIPSTTRVDVSVHAIEMVYVPEGSFKVGSGGTESGSFTEGSWSSGATLPLQISGEGALTIAHTAGNLWGTSTSGDNTIGSAGTLPAAYPKGYKAFYCMKYEISQGQWVSFFNMLTDSQKSTRDITAGTYNISGKQTDLATNRNTIAWSGGDATCTTPNTACNFLSWADLAAYADWAGLRPMTELEFEKACRGPLNPVAGEYAWGTAAIIDDDGNGTIDLSSPENGTEVWTNSALAQLGVGGKGAAVFGNNTIRVNGVDSDVGPVRCGLFAAATSTRITSGATYWGIMEMSGNVWERTVMVADAGRTFTGAVGNGKLDSTGNADVEYWPGTSPSGNGFRGGHLVDSQALCVSERIQAAYSTGRRTSTTGGRAMRSVQ